MDKLRQLVHIVAQNGLLFATSLVTAMTLFALVAVMGLIFVKGLGHFWINPVAQVQYVKSGEPRKDFGYILEHAADHAGQQRVWLRRDSYQFSRPSMQVILDQQDVLSVSYPSDVYYVRLNDGRELLAKAESVIVAEQIYPWQSFTDYRKQVGALVKQKRELQLGEIAAVHNAIDDLQRRNVVADAPARERLARRYQALNQQLAQLNQQIMQFQVSLTNANGDEIILPLHTVARIMTPNQLTSLDKLAEFSLGLWQFLSESTQDANQSGGVFPAIFGTVLMVLLMTVMVTPLGIVAAIYLTEYAPNNTVIMVIRIAVSNLAGVPSVVYGVFGLGFFVYQVGGNIDALFYADKLPTATFGTPGLLWASLTMALLTLPVVIVAAEEGLRRVPKGLRSASYALGATKYETIKKVVLPVASSSLMTGIILAIARGAGEVAPMLMVGAVKYAPVLPIDAEFPFVHLERQFMHLGVLIYDGAFHGQVVQDGSTMMFAACLLLLLVVSMLNMVAIVVRNKLQNRYHTTHYD